MFQSGQSLLHTRSASFSCCNGLASDRLATCGDTSRRTGWNIIGVILLHFGYIKSGILGGELAVAMAKALNI